MKRVAAWTLVGLCLGYVVFGGREAIAYPEVIVPAARILRTEPDTVVRWRDRVVYRYLQPDQVAVAPGAAAQDVAAFCRPVAVTSTDTMVVDRRILLRSVAHSPGWLIQRDGLAFTAVSNTGDLERLTFRVRGGWSARAVGDSLLVRYPRTSLFRQVAEPLAMLLIGWKVLP